MTSKMQHHFGKMIVCCEVKEIPYHLMDLSLHLHPVRKKKDGMIDTFETYRFNIHMRPERSVKQ